VFPAHAENPDWELGDSRISKLWIQRLADRTTVFEWDRGPGIEAADELAAAFHLRFGDIWQLAGASDRALYQESDHQFGSPPRKETSD
jgi:hypothetical protein